MVILILILVSSLLFLVGFLNSTKKLLLQLKKLFFPSLDASTLQPNPSPTNSMNKDGYDDLKQVFDTFDDNKDGFITRQELKESLKKIGIFVPIKEVEEIVESLDFNKDGLIDLEEFGELFEMIKGRKMKVFDDDEGDLKEAFDVFDGDKDGLITVEELGFVLSSLGLKEGKREQDCREMIRKVDMDGDGMVNFDEFKRMMRAGFGT